MLRTTLLAAALIAAGTTFAAAQGGGAGGEPPRLGDANPPVNALRNGGIPPAAAARRDGPAMLRRDDAMAPFQQRDVGMPQSSGNNPTPTLNDPAGTRTQCRGACQ